MDLLEQNPCIPQQVVLFAGLFSQSAAVFSLPAPLGLGQLSAWSQGSFVWFPGCFPVFFFFVSLRTVLSVGITGSVG